MTELYDRIAEMARLGIPGVVATVIRTEGSVPRKVGAKMIIHQDGRITGTIGGGSVEAAVIKESAAVMQEGVPRVAAYNLTEGDESVGSICGGRMEIFLEPLSAGERLFIFGAGHIAQPLAEMAKRVGFRVIVIDDRPEFANAERFGTADEIVVKDLAKAGEELTLGPDAYVVVITRGHEKDYEVVRGAIGRTYRYIGMIGSRKKVAAIISRLKDTGFSEETLGRLHAPIGLEIGAETPEEIAVSILAEMVEVRRREGP